MQPLLYCFVVSSALLMMVASLPVSQFYSMRQIWQSRHLLDPTRQQEIEDYMRSRASLFMAYNCQETFDYVHYTDPSGTEAVIRQFPLQDPDGTDTDPNSRKWYIPGRKFVKCLELIFFPRQESQMNGVPKLLGIEPNPELGLQLQEPRFQRFLQFFYSITVAPSLVDLDTKKMVVRFIRFPDAQLGIELAKEIYFINQNAVHLANRAVDILYSHLKTLFPKCDTDVFLQSVTHILDLPENEAYRWAYVQKKIQDKLNEEISPTTSESVPLPSDSFFDEDIRQLQEENRQFSYTEYPAAPMQNPPTFDTNFKRNHFAGEKSNMIPGDFYKDPRQLSVTNNEVMTTSVDSHNFQGHGNPVPMQTNSDQNSGITMDESILRDHASPRRWQVETPGPTMVRFPLEAQVNPIGDSVLTAPPPSSHE